MKAKKTIIFFTGVYDTLDLFTDQLKETFTAMGYATFVYDASSEAVSKEALLSMLVEADVCERSGLEGKNVLTGGAWGGEEKKNKSSDLSSYFACVTFNNLGYNLDFCPEDIIEDASGSGVNHYNLPQYESERGMKKQKKANVWEYYNIPYINILMDHPFHYEKPLRNAPKTAVVLCTDQNHVRYIRRFYRNIRQTDFLPHAGVELGHRHKPLAERSIDVLYAGALPIYTVGHMIPDLDSIPEVDGQAMTQEVLAELVHHPEKTTEEVIESYLKSVRSDLSNERIHQIIVEMRFLDSYATSFFREQAVRSLVENGIRVTAYGTGWDQCEWSDNPYLTYGGKVLAPQILPLMNDSKIVLNTMTWFKAGAHDRIFNGMLAGAAVVTDDSAYLRHEFTDGKELVMFALPEIGTLPERVFHLFGHLSETQEMAENGYETALKHHNWRQRAEYIVDCFL